MMKNVKIQLTNPSDMDELQMHPPGVSDMEYAEAMQKSLPPSYRAKYAGEEQGWLPLGVLVERLVGEKRNSDMLSWNDSRTDALKSVAGMVTLAHIPPPPPMGEAAAATPRDGELVVRITRADRSINGMEGFRISILYQ